MKRLNSYLWTIGWMAMMPIGCTSSSDLSSIAAPAPERRAPERTVDMRAKIPQAAPPGVYELLLNLPDPLPKLANRPEYAIRLANAQTWEAKTGFNSLRRTVQVIR